MYVAIFAGQSLLFDALVLLAALLVLVFEVWMLIEAIKNPALGQQERVLWIVGMVLIHPFVAIAYYFMRHSGHTS